MPKGLLSAIDVGKKGDDMAPDSDAGGGDVDDVAVDQMMDAIKSGDRDGFASALKSYVTNCIEESKSGSYGAGK